MKDPILTEEAINRFHERGVLLFDFGLETDLLDRIIAEVEPHYDGLLHDRPQPPIRVQDAWRQVEPVRQLAVNNRILRALEELLQRKPLPFQTLNFPVGTTQLAHSDTIHFSTLPKGYMVGVWVALEDIDEDNGPLIYYPGSHRMPYYTMQDLGLGCGYDYYQDYEQCIQQLIRKHGFDPEYGTVSKGQAIIWHANLLHGGADRSDPRRTRHSQVTHYYFEGCKYYTPLESQPGKLCYRNPQWIPVSTEAMIKAKIKPEPEQRSWPVRMLNRFRRILG